MRFWSVSIYSGRVRIPSVTDDDGGRIVGEVDGLALVDLARIQAERESAGPLRAADLLRQYRQEMEVSAHIVLAGSVAESKRTRKSIIHTMKHAGEKDWQIINQYATLFEPDEAARTALINQLLEETRCIVNSYRHEIEILARELDKKRSIEFERCCQLMDIPSPPIFAL